MLARLISETYLSAVAFGFLPGVGEGVAGGLDDAQRARDAVAEKLGDEIGDLRLRRRVR